MAQTLPPLYEESEVSTGWLLTHSFATYLLGVFVVHVWFLPTLTWPDALLHSLPLLLVPIIVYLMKRICILYCTHKAAQSVQPPEAKPHTPHTQLQEESPSQTEQGAQNTVSELVKRPAEQKKEAGATALSLLAESGKDSKWETLLITLRKGKQGFGFKIDKLRSGQKDSGLFVLSVDSDPAKAEGRLRAGDEVVEVNGMSLLNKSHQEAVNVLRSVIGTGSLLVRRTRQTTGTE